MLPDATLANQNLAPSPWSTSTPAYLSTGYAGSAPAVCTGSDSGIIGSVRPKYLDFSKNPI